MIDGTLCTGASVIFSDPVRAMAVASAAGTLSASMLDLASGVVGYTRSTGGLLITRIACSSRPRSTPGLVPVTTMGDNGWAAPGAL
jgi:hypothetical protein